MDLAGVPHFARSATDMGLDFCTGATAAMARVAALREFRRFPSASPQNVSWTLAGLEYVPLNKCRRIGTK